MAAGPHAELSILRLPLHLLCFNGISVQYSQSVSVSSHPTAANCVKRDLCGATNYEMVQK